MHAFYCEKIEAAGDIVTLERMESDHLFKTLRGRVGDVVMLLDGKGKSAMAEIVEGKALRVNEIKIHEAPAKDIYLFMAAPRKQKLDQILKQATELGVKGIAIMHCDFSVALPEGSSRWETILLEACKQSNNPFIPEILPVMKFQEALNYIEKNQIVGIFGDVEESKESLSASENMKKFAFFVGPEGGFSDKEISQMRSNGFVGLNLGPYILRLETAAVCGIAVLRKIFTN